MKTTLQSDANPIFDLPQEQLTSDFSLPQGQGSSSSNPLLNESINPDLNLDLNPSPDLDGQPQLNPGPSTPANTALFNPAIPSENTISAPASTPIANPENPDSFSGELILDPVDQLVTVNDPTPTVSVLWDQAVQQAVINVPPSSTGPTVASRAYGLVHTAMFDAWAAYDPTAVSTQLGDELQVSASENTDANKEEAMSYAAYQVLTELFPSETATFDALMTQLGFDPSNITTDTTTAAGIGNISAEALLAFRRNDGSNQRGIDPEGRLGVPYSDTTGYTPFNQLGESRDIERWTPENVPIDAQPSEIDRTQEFLTPQWGDVTPFGLDSGDQFRPEAPQPFLMEGVEGEVDLEAKTVTLTDGTVLPISKDLVGTIINTEFVAQAERLIDVSANLTDEQKLIAEFWEDGGGTSFPPGTWMTFGQFVSARDDNSLDTDAQQFFALGNAVFDAGVATWESKTFYDYTRPVRAIRDLGDLGLVGQQGVDEQTGEEGFVIDAWGGPEQGTQTILADNFLTYQTPGGDPSPPFAEYTSGHSAFSASGAEVLKLFTGSDSFGGSVSFQPGESRFESTTPTDPVTLEWDTFSTAADEAGISRVYGGIHFDEGDLNGRTLGRQVGGSALDQALFFINGGRAVNSIAGSEEQDVLHGTKGDDRIVAFGGNDVIRAGRGDDQVLGGDGNDSLLGQKGSDTLVGGSEDDVLLGGRGTDDLNGGVGNDVLYGGDGADLFRFEGELLDGLSDIDVVQSFQVQDSFNFDDYLSAGGSIGATRISNGLLQIDLSGEDVLNVLGGREALNSAEAQLAALG